MKTIKIITGLLTGMLLLGACQSRQGINIKESKGVCLTNVISKEHLADLLYSGQTDDVQFIDVRTPHQYAMGHLPGAINLPLKNYYDKKYFKKINGNKVLILYGDQNSNPELVAMLLKHFHGTTTYVIPGSYAFVRNRILDHYGIHSGIYDDEIPLVDFKKAINEIRQREGGGASAPAAKPAAAAPKPIVKHKKKEVTGGCG